jgi:hypothetical protein
MVAMATRESAVTPTLAGRLQTRVALLILVGVPTTLLVVPLVSAGLDVSVADAYTISFRALIVTLVVGIGWELIYHLLQQLRWERDWPTLFALVVGVPESVVVYLSLRWGLAPDGSVLVRIFVLHFASVWIAVWVALAIVPVLVPLWRHRGGRFW